MEEDLRDKDKTARLLSLLESHYPEPLLYKSAAPMTYSDISSITKHVGLLREMGYVILQDENGCRLLAEGRHLLPEEFTRGLETITLGRSGHYFDTVNSTQDIARELMSDASSDGTIIVAGEQTCGRGRERKRWVSPRGGIWFSVILRDIHTRSMTLVSLASALAVSRALKDTLGIGTRLKWPNDVILDGCKVAGILIDASTMAGQYPAAAVGIGINYDVDVQKIRGGITEQGLDAAAIGREKPGMRTVIIQSVLSHLESAIRVSQESGMRTITEWSESSDTIGRMIRAGSGRGICGRATGLDSDGALLLEHDGGTTRVTAGEIRDIGESSF